jgi:hypothetical protein
MVPSGATVWRIALDGHSVAVLAHGHGLGGEDPTLVLAHVGQRQDVGRAVVEALERSAIAAASRPPGRGAGARAQERVAALAPAEQLDGLHGDEHQPKRRVRGERRVRRPRHRDRQVARRGRQRLEQLRVAVQARHGSAARGRGRARRVPCPQPTSSTSRR